jgi:exosortase A-associated hydrolase 2
VLQAFYLPVDRGNRFCVVNASASTPRGAIVYVHPFAEEMHKSRRMAALQARRLAARGWLVLQVDLCGCGDSSGDFGDARWETWARDVRAGLAWAKARISGPLALWGLRLGAMLACELAADAALGIERVVLWQPVASGEQFLSQFLRLRLAAEMLSGGAATSALGELRAALAQGRTLEIAGYELHPELAMAIERLELASLRPAAKRIDWLEVSAEPAQSVRPGSQRVVERWRAEGVDVRSASVAGEPFWSTIEIAECEALLEATTEALA